MSQIQELIELAKMNQAATNKIIELFERENQQQAHYVPWTTDPALSKKLELKIPEEKQKSPAKKKATVISDSDEEIITKEDIEELSQPVPQMEGVKVKHTSLEEEEEPIYNAFPPGLDFKEFSKANRQAKAQKGAVKS